MRKFVARVLLGYRGELPAFSSFFPENGQENIQGFKLDHKKLNYKFLMAKVAGQSRVILSYQPANFAGCRLLARTLLREEL